MADFRFKTQDEIDAELRRECQEVLRGLSPVHECSEQEQYLRDWEKDFQPDMGEKWREKVYSGEVELPDIGFNYDGQWFLVGGGERKDTRCGTFRHRKTKKLRGCLRLKLHAGVKLDGIDYTNKVFVKRVFHSCNRPECPSCGVTGWAVRESMRAERRLLFAYLKLGKVEHIIVSPPQDVDWDFKKLKKYVLKAMLRRGIVGGCMIYHHFRYRNSYVARRTGLKLGWFRSPHFHVLGFIKGGYGNCRNCAHHPDKVFSFARCMKCNGFMGNQKRAYGYVDEKGAEHKGDRVICKVKGERKTVGGTLWYQLSHASLKRGVKKQNVVLWFGECGRNKLKIPKGRRPQRDVTCEICGQKLYDIVYLGNYKSLLRFMGVHNESQGFIFDAKDADGNWLWRAKHPEDCKDG